MPAIFAFTMDINESGAIDTGSSFELIAYRYDPLNMWLERYDAATGTWQIVPKKSKASRLPIAGPMTGHGDARSPVRIYRHIRMWASTFQAARAAHHALSEKVKCRNMGT